MKYAITLLLAAFCLTSYGQVSEKTKTMSLGAQNAFIVSIPDAKDDLIIDIWNDYLKEYGKTKKVRKTKEYFNDDIKIASIAGSGTMDFYATSEDGQLILFIDMGNGFLSSETHAEAYEGAEVFLNEFRNEVIREMIREELKKEEKGLNKLDKSLKSLVKDNEKYHNIIEKAKERIAKAEADIEQNIIDQANTQTEIEGQKKVVEEVKEKLENVGK